MGKFKHNAIVLAVLFVGSHIMPVSGVGLSRLLGGPYVCVMTKIVDQKNRSLTADDPYPTPCNVEFLQYVWIRCHWGQTLIIALCLSH